MRSFSVRRIISTDYFTGFFTYAFFIVWIMYFIIWIMNLSFMGDSTTFIDVAILFTCIGIPVFIWRIRFFKVMYNRGLEINGTISYAAFVGRGDAVRYEYTFQNQKYVSGTALAPNYLHENNYNVGDDVVLLVDPKKPKRAVIKEIYF